ncbi:hypothetical protein, partial [Phenylobacterium sp.]|uniref:hypothetical protein n=1 Tax=Phenylobacterium sp. TaxID=1871053 RepID=UPI002811833F
MTIKVSWPPLRTTVKLSGTVVETTSPGWPKAAEAGTVTYAGSEVKGYGNLVLIAALHVERAVVGVGRDVAVVVADQ